MGKGDPKGGRPYALNPDDETLKQVKGLGRLHATAEDCAGFFAVSKPTWLDFLKRCPEAADAFDHGKADGRLSLRRRQFLVAESGNPTMLIWLGKQHLDQKDKAEVASTLNVTVTDARSALESLVDRHAATEREEESPIRTH